MKVTEPLANVAVRVSPSSVSALGPLVLVLRGAAAVPAAVADLVGTSLATSGADGNWPRMMLK